MKKFIYFLMALTLLTPAITEAGYLLIEKQTILSTSAQVTHLNFYQAEEHLWVIEVYYEGQNNPAIIYSHNLFDANTHFNNLRKYLKW